MAFGSSVGGSRERLAAVLKIRADTGQAKTEISELGRSVESVMRGMTAEQIKLDRATKHFQQTLKTYGAEHERTKTAALRLDAAEKRLHASLRQNEVQVRRNTRALDSGNRSLARMTRGAIAGSGIFQALGRSMAFASAGFIGATGFVYGARAALNAASDLNEQVNKTREVFLGASGEVIAFSEGALGLSKRQALETTSTLGALLHAMGVMGPTAKSASVELTKLGVDLASFYNTSVEDSLAAIQSALVGQVRPMRRYGAEVSAAREKLVAMAMTGKTSATELTRQERVLARLNIIFKDTKVAQGDFLQTSQGLANQQRTLTGNLEDTAAVIGQALIPAAEDASQSINKWLESSENQRRLQRDVNEAIKIGTGVVRGFAGAIEKTNAVLGPVIKAFGGFEKAAALAFGLGFALKIKKAMVSMGLLATSVNTTTAIVVTDAARMGTALDVALRPRTLVVTGGGLLKGKGGIAGMLAGAGLFVGGQQVGGEAGGFMTAAGTGAITGGMFGPWGAVIGAAAGLSIQAATAPDAATAVLKKAWNKMTADQQTAALQSMGGAEGEAFLKKYGLTWKGRMSGGPRPEEGLQGPTTGATGTSGKLTAAQIRANSVKRAENRIKALGIFAERANRTEPLTDDIKVAKQIAAQFLVIKNLKKTVEASIDYENALTAVYQLEKQQAEQADAAAKQREQERKQRAAAAEARAKEAARSYRAMLAAKETRLETAVDRAGTLKALKRSRAKLIAFLRAETNDRKLTDKERARYEQELAKVQNSAVNDELKLREGTLKRRLTVAKGTAGKTDDEIAQKNLIAFYEAAAKRAGQTVKQVRSWLDKKAKAQTALAGLIKKDRQDENRSSSQLALDFLNTRADFFSSFGPNVFTQQGSGAGTTRMPGSRPSSEGGTTVTVNQHFTSSPEDTFRAAKMTKFAMDSAV